MPRVIKRKAGHRLIRVSPEEIGVQHHFMRQSVQIQKGTARVVVDRPKWNAAANARLAVCTADFCPVDVFTPKCQLARNIGCELERSQRYRQSQFMSRGRSQTFALIVPSQHAFFPGQRVLGWFIWWRRQCGRLDAAVADAGVGRPAQIVQNRLAQDEMVQTRQPLGLREVLVQPNIGSNGPGAIQIVLFQLDSSGLVFPRIPLAFVLLFEEIIVADQAQFRSELKAAR